MGRRGCDDKDKSDGLRILCIKDYAVFRVSQCDYRMINSRHFPMCYRNSVSNTCRLYPLPSVHSFREACLVDRYHTGHQKAQPAGRLRPCFCKRYVYALHLPARHLVRGYGVPEKGGHQERAAAIQPQEDRAEHFHRLGTRHAGNSGHLRPLDQRQSVPTAHHHQAGRHGTAAIRTDGT